MKTLLLGYFDLNFGDDWLIINYANKYKNENVELLLSDEKLFTPFVDDKRFSYKKSKFDKIKSMISVKDLVIVGGSMFQFKKYWFSHFLKVFLLVFFIRLIGGKCSVIGCNIKNEENKFFKFFMVFMFKIINDFRVRDKVSENSLINYYQVKRFKVSLEKDLADNCFVSYPKYKNRCSISIINNDSINDNKYFDTLDIEIKNMLDIGVDEFCFFSFDSGHESDQKAIKKYILHLKNKNININYSIVNYNSNVIEFGEKWSESAYAITTRFHSYILSKNSNQNIKILSYSKKINSYIDTFYKEDIRLINDI